MSEQKLIQMEAVQDLFFQFMNGAVLDGKNFTDVIDPYDHCVRIVRSWGKQNE